MSFAMDDDDDDDEVTTLTPLTRLTASADASADTKPRSACRPHIFLCAVLLGILIGVVAIEAVRRVGFPGMLPMSDAGTNTSAGGQYSLLAAISPTTSNATASVCLSLMDRFGNHVYMIMMGLRLAVQHEMQLRLVTHCEYAELFPAIPPFHAECPKNEEVDMNVPPHAVDGGPWWATDPRTKSHSPDFHVSLHQWFQYPTALYAPIQRQLREMLTPHPKLAQWLGQVRRAMLRQHCADSLIVSIHIRHGDYPEPQNTAGFRQVRLPLSWYFDWVQRMKTNGTDVLSRAKALQDLDCPIPVATNWTVNDLTLFIISDDDAVPGKFREAGYTVIETKQILTAAFGPYLAFAGQANGFYVDWWLYSQQRVMVASHSTFSLTGALLSPHSELAGEGFFYRPLADTLAIGPFEPWNFHYIDDHFIGKIN